MINNADWNTYMALGGRSTKQFNLLVGCSANILRHQ